MAGRDQQRHQCGASVRLDVEEPPYGYPGQSGRGGGGELVECFGLGVAG